MPQSSGWDSKKSTETVKLPAEIHESSIKALNEASEAHQKRDHQLALALLHGVFYKGGVKVAVDPKFPAPNQAAREGLGRSLSTWSTTLEGDSPIQFINDASAADVKIQFVDKVPRSGHDALGLIELKKEYRWNRLRYEIEITGTIYIQTHFDKNPLDATQYSEVIAHELGHLLGLDDMPNPGQLMGPMIVNQPIPNPNKRESYAVQILRHQAKKQWNSVVEDLNFSGFSADSHGSRTHEYQASCTGKSGCRYGK
jgi:hypothetical protein